MGWFVEDYHGQLMWQHGGNTTGMTAAVGMLPEKHIGVAVLSNMQSAQLPAIVMHYIFDRALGLPMRDLSAEAYARYLVQRRRADSVTAAQAVEHPRDAKPPLPLNAFVGTYADSLYGEATVSIVEGQLELHRGDWHGAASILEREQLPMGPSSRLAHRPDEHQVRDLAGQHGHRAVVRHRR